MTTLNILLGIILCISGYIAWKQHSTTQNGDPKLQAELERRMQELGEMKQQIADLQFKKQELEVNAKGLYASTVKLESELQAVRKDRDALNGQVTKYQTEDSQKQKRSEEMAGRLENAQKALEEEKVRIRREDEERLKQAEEARDRLWAAHENAVVSELYDLCKKPQYAFHAYDNTKLPDGFDGSLKPDFLINFLDQYVIFDAKVSRSQDLQTYIKDAVKKTAKKVKGSANIYPTVFLVVPTEAVSTLKHRSFYEEGLTFYIVSPEALEPILASLKRIETYEFAQEMDPQDRENIIDTLAQFHFHISFRNAIDYRLMEHGIESLAKMKDSDSDFMREVLIKSQKIRHLNLNTSDTKQLSSNPEVLYKKLNELTKPTAKLSKEELSA